MLLKLMQSWGGGKEACVCEGDEYLIGVRLVTGHNGSMVDKLVTCREGAKRHQIFNPDNPGWV